MIHAKTSYFPAWNKRFYFLYFIDSSDSFHPFRRNFDRSFIFTTDNIPLLFQVQLGSRCHQAESAYPTIKVTQVFPSSPCLGILFSPQGHYHIQLFFELFSSPCLGILFSLAFIGYTMIKDHLFSSPCLGILFSRDGVAYYKASVVIAVFVPMFGDSFFTRGASHVFTAYTDSVFVPMFGDSFFT